LTTGTERVLPLSIVGHLSSSACDKKSCDWVWGQP
jgi:hypothetical protein